MRCRIPALSGLLGLLLSLAPALAQPAPRATSVSPATVPAGTGALSVTLQGNFPGAGNNVYAFCVFSGGVATKIAPTSITTTTAVLPLPASTLQLNPSFFNSGVASVEITLASIAATCADPGTNYNVALQVAYPTISSANVLSLQQNNVAPAPDSVPNRIEVLGDNFLAGSTYATVKIDTAYTSGQIPANVITTGSLTFPRPNVNDLGQSNFVIGVCNFGRGNTYCSLSPSPQVTLYAPASTTLTASAAPASVNGGGVSTVSVSIVTPGVIQTAAGTFVPGAPSGTVFFTDATTTTQLGSSRVIPTALAFTGASSQPITITTGGFHSDSSPKLLTPLVADFNQDGTPDTLIIQNAEATMQLFLGGSPAGTLRPSQPITFADSCYSLPAAAVADFNGDGYPDIAYLCGDSGGGSQIYLALNQGDGTFPDQGYYIADAGSATQLAAGLFNNDSIIDLVATGQTNPYYETPVYGIETFFGTAGTQPTFNPGPVTVTTDIPGVQIVAADFNNDRSTDIALLHTDTATGNVSVQPYQNDGSGNFTPITAIHVSTSTTRLFARPFTLSSTVYPDLAVVEPGTGVAVILNRKTASVAFATPVQTSFPTLTDALFGDFDGDTLADLVYYDAATIRVLSGKGDGAFSNVYGQSLTEANLVLEAAPDLNVDGHADLVFYAHNGPNSEFLFNNLASAVTTGTGSATFQALVGYSPGIHTITTSYSGNVDLLASSGTTSITVTQITPTITWNPPTTATTTTPIDATYLNATASVPGTFAYTPASGSYLASGSQTLIAVFTPTDSATYAPVTTTRIISVSTTPISTLVIAATPANQTFHSGVPTVISVTLNGTHFSPTGTVQFFDGSSNIGSAPLTATTAGSSIATLTLPSIASGSHAFGAGYAGSGIYSALVVPLSRYIPYNVGQLTPTLTWTPSPQTIAYGTTLSAAQLDAVAKDASGTIIPGTFIYAPASGALLSAGEHPLSVTFNPTDTTNYSSATDNSSITVTQFSPVITWHAPASIAYGTALSATQLDATVTGPTTAPNVPGTFTYTPAAGSILAAGTQTLSVSFTPTDTTNFRTVTGSTVINITKIAPTITWPSIAAITQGTALSSTQFNATATGVNNTSLPGNFTYTPAAGTIPQAGTQSLSLLFTPTDLVDYTTATATNSVAVNKAPTVTTLASSANPASLSEPINLTATVTRTPASTTALTGSVTFVDGSTSLGVATVTAGIATLPATIHTIGSHLITATYTGDVNNLSSQGQLTQLVVTNAPVITWIPNVATFPFGTPLGDDQLNATAKTATGTTIPGTFAYDPIAGTILPVGSKTLSVTFTPTDTVTYTAASATTTITVLQSTGTSATLAITSGGTPATTIASGAVITLTATVTSASTPITSGQVNFCDATVPYCTDIHLFGTAQITRAGIASIKLSPSIGGHSYKAVFLPTTDYASASSPATPLTVTGKYATTTAIAATGGIGNYTLTATTTGFANPASAPTGTVSFVDTTNANTTLATASLASATEKVTFAISNSPTTGSGYLSTATGDFNGDGKPDLAVTNRYSDTLTVMLGNGDGTFTTASTNPTGSMPQLIAVGDFNGDGLLDIATPNFNDSTVTILLGKGNGNFTVGATPSTGASLSPVGIATADFNGDGKLDLAVTTEGNQTVTILLGNGDGTFTAASAAPAIGSTSFVTVSGDFNGDGKPDLAVSNFNSNTVTILLGNGDGTFTTAPTINTGNNPLAIALGDFNGDGKLDLAVPNFNDDTINILLGNGDGTFAPASTITVGSQPYSVAVGDFNGDGKLDISVPNFGDNTVTILLGKGDGTFTPSALATAGGYPSFISVGDFNGDGDTDLAIANQASSTAPGPAVTILLTQLTQAVTATATGISPLRIGTPQHQVVATYPGDASFSTSASASVALTEQPIVTPTIVWTPTVATIPYGTPLGAQQLNAMAVAPSGAAISGIFTYTPAAGTILQAGTTTLSVLFTPTNAVLYTTATATATVPITVNIPASTTTLATTINPSQYGQLTNLVATVVRGGSPATVLTGSVSFFDGTKLLGTSPVNQFGLATFPVSTLTAAAHTLTAAYTGDTANAASTSAAFTQSVTRAPAVVTFAPNPASFVYGTPLSAAQLDATVTSLYVPTVPGAFVYTPAIGAVLGAGTTNLSTTFTPTDAANFSPATRTASLTVTKATPTVTFPTPPYTVVGSALTAAQLSASATGVNGAALPGTFTYSPAAGSIVTAGPQVLTVTFTPTDATAYNTAQATTTLNGTPLTLASLDSTKATLGDKAKTVTLTGTGFVSDSVARSNGTALATTYVNATTLQAILPATSFLTVQTLQISVFDPTQNQTTASIPFTVAAPPVNATVTAPTTASPGDQPSITLNLATPYAFPVTAKFSLAFTPVSGGVVDPSIQFAGGGLTTSFDVAAGQTTAPPVQIQSGTVAGVIRITLALTAGGMDVTPAGTAATVITIPAVIPGLTQVAVAGTGSQITVTTFGFSNTREISQAHFHFTPAAGKQIQTQDITLDVTSVFSGWFTQTASDAYGSAFLYTQTFTLDDDASVVGQVTVTLSNSIGVSAVGTSQ